MRVVINDFKFGKYEVHDEKVSWKGFGTAASFDGASLKGAEKTIYFFLELQKGNHTIKFFADETPSIKEIKVSQLGEDENFEVEKLRSSDYVKTDKKGIPFLSFVFLGIKPKGFSIASTCKSAAQKKTSDGDNLKVFVNGEILQNEKAPTSDKYKNFYFSGDLNKGKSEVLKIEPKAFEFLEDSVELWYDESPSVYVNIDLFDNVNRWISKVEKKILQSYYYSFVTTIAVTFKTIGWEYSSQFLFHSLKDKPEKLIFNNDNKLVAKIKENEEYQKIISIIKNQIRKEGESGQVQLGDVKNNLDVSFKGGDLEYSLHGLHKVDYEVISKKESEIEVNFTIFDVYDFVKKGYPLNLFKAPYIFANNQVDAAEFAGIVNNFEIEIRIQETLKIKDE